MKKILLTVFYFLSIINILESQTVIKGIVKSAEDSTLLPGVSIIVKGATIGTTTDINGKYQLSVPKEYKTLVFSFVGYNTITKEIQPGNNTINVTISSNVKQLNEFVVTALGIKKEKKAVGYSVQEINGDNLQTAKDPNLINQLAGKAAGVEVSSTTGGPGSSARIILRGNRSLASNNQALIVVDGVPVENNTVNTTNQWGGLDYGNGVSDINPDDIESISILKGASASALYGSLASNGVILITTKKGKAQKGVGVTINSITSVESPYILEKFQNVYGAGRDGQFIDPWATTSGTPTYNTASPNAFGSWGPKMQDQSIVDWDGVTRTFDPQPNNYRDFYQIGTTFNNNISLDGGNEKASYRISFNNFTNKDIVPKTTLDKNNVTAKIVGNINSKWSFELSANFTNQKAHNRLGLSNSFSAPRNIIMMPRNISNSSLKNDMMNSDGKEQVWYTNWNWMSNPYWIVNYETNDDERNRMINNFNTSYKFSKNLSLLIRASNDFHTTEFNSISAYDGVSNPLGGCSKGWEHYFQQNYDFLLSYNKKLSSKINFSLSAGGNTLIKTYDNNSISTKGGLQDPYFYNPLLGKDGYEASYYHNKKQINSLYSFGQISYNEYLFVDFTFRNDWSSTLPSSHYSYSYPSINTSFIFSDALKLESKAFSFGKIRLSWAQVGSDTDPYRLEKTYTSSSTLFNGAPMISVNTTIPNLNLKPEITTSKEVGTELKFFQNRISTDFTYYYTITRNQILAADVAPSTGSSQAMINSGRIDNKGFEMQLKGTPFKNKFRWDVSFNFSTNKSKVIELYPGLESYTLLDQWNLSIEARPGHEYGDIVGYTILRDANGNKVLNDTTHLYERGPKQVLGNINPKWIGGITNTFSYKSITLSFLIDMHIGGKMFAGSDMYGYGYSGNFVQTLADRDAWYASEAQRIAAGASSSNWVATGGTYVEGVLPDGTTWKGFVNPEKYWGDFSDWTHEIHEPFIYDATFVKLREATITWDLPSKIFSKLKIRSASVSLFGRNLWIIYKNVPNIDPESAYTNGNGQGYEIYSYPTRRSIGIDLKVNF